MIDKTPQITAFLQKHYQPGTIEANALKVTNEELLAILFKVFPLNCIDTDELFDILVSLGYEPQKASHTEFYWCLQEHPVTT